MVLHVPLSREGFLAEVAGKGLLIRVDSRMNYQIRPFREGFTAALVWTCEWLGPIVTVEMRFKPAFPRKTFMAALERA